MAKTDKEWIAHKRRRENEMRIREPTSRTVRVARAISLSKYLIVLCDSDR